MLNGEELYYKSIKVLKFCLLHSDLRKEVFLNDSIIKRGFDDYSLQLVKKYDFVRINQLITFANISTLINGIAF